jgi:hypothetical protein
MESMLLLCLIVVLVIRWIQIRDRFERIEREVAELRHLRSFVPAPAPVVVPPPAPVVLPQAAVVRPPVITPPVEPPRFTMPPAAPLPSKTDWEAVVGGNWLNKLGVVILVIGIALALGYSFTRMGPAGRVGLSLAASAAMLASGMVLEPRERYRTFARGLLGGGWAALYTTVFAMHAVPAARIVDNVSLALALLLAVAAGMIVHSLRYCSQTVTGLAYFLGFLTLAITEVTGYSLVAVMLLAVSLLFVARRFKWRTLARLGVVATWLLCAHLVPIHAFFWQPALGLLALYWLVFEVFDLLMPDPWILPCNLAGFLLLSLRELALAEPGRIWQLLAVMSAVYVAGALVRAKSGKWRSAITAAAGLAAAAIWLRVDAQWVPLGLLAEAEALHLAGILLRQDYLRILAGPLFGLDLADLAVNVAPQFPVAVWTPVAAANAAALYGNRALRRADVVYGFGGLAMAALLAGTHAPANDRGLAWMTLAALPFVAGWLWRQFDLRAHGYLLATLGVFAMAYQWPERALSPAIGAALFYAAALCAEFSAADRFLDSEPESLRFAGAAMGGVLFVAALWLWLPSAALAPALAVLALVSAAPWKTGDLRWQATALALLAFLRCVWINFRDPHPALATAAVIACLYAAQCWSPRGGRRRFGFSLLATTLLTALLFHQVSGSLLTIAWGAEGVLLLASGFPLRDRILRLSGLGLLFLCILKLFLYDLASLATLPRIFSFLVLGVILVGVSWIYTRFRDRIERYL